MLDSIPLLTSTPGGLYLDIKSLIFSGLSPPAVKYGNDKNNFILYQSNAPGQPVDSDITNTTTGSLSTPYTTGTFNFSQMMYIVQGKKGYINFQAENIPGVSWALEVNFETNGTILMTNTLGTTFSCNYPQGSWFEINFLVDLSNNIWDV